MPAPLLETKLFVPGPRPGMVPRLRLSERLTRGTAGPLTLVSAPAGFGKTTLLAQWLADRAAGSADARTVAWLSLDQGDNDSALFWAYVIAALQKAAPAVGVSALGLLQDRQPPSIQLLLTTLLNDFGAIATDIVLVLDDYHVIDSRDVQQGLAFLLDHIPPQLHMLIASRADPALPLARLRARGELVEVRAADLRFTTAEAAAYLNDTMGLQLAAPDVAALEGRTEGWIAALQLAALSMQGRDDVTGFIAGFAGDDRYVVDYLVEEVVQRQPPDVQAFLLETSILDRLSGPLCDAVTGQRGGKAMLTALDRGNLFLVPLDDRRQWYRYHQLFADVMQARLLDEQPGHVDELHQRASAWYEAIGEPSEAIRHALAAKNFGHAADLMELAIPAMARERRESTLCAWLETFPDGVRRVRPVLTNGYAGALLSTGQVERVEPYLREVENWIEASATASEQPGLDPTELVVVDEAAFHRLPGAVAIYRAGQAMARGDATTTVTYAKRALDLLEDDDHIGRGAAAGLMGLAYWISGDLESAHRAYSDCTARLFLAGYVADTLGCAIALADIRMVQGRLDEAMRTFEQALRLASEQGGPVLRGTADMHVGMSAIHCERGDLTSATHELLESQQLGDQLGLPQNRYRWRVAMARVREAEGDLSGAVDLLEEAERFYIGDFFPNVRPVPALTTRVCVVQGRLADAFRWARERGLAADDDLSYLREFEHVTLARMLLARYESERTATFRDEATQLLERLRLDAEEGDRWGSVIEILALQALAQQVSGDIRAGLVPLERALTLAEPEGYVRVFVNEGPRMAALLEAVALRRPGSTYVRRLLAAFDQTLGTGPLPQQLVEPLSAREQEVLRLLATELSGPDIARDLVVSLNTVRTHTKSIYAKLGVNNRRAAIRKATDLDLL